MSLQEYLDLNIAFLHRAVQNVKAGGDLAPMMGFVKPDGQIVGMVTEWSTSDARELQAQMLRGALEATNATMYMVLSAAWSSQLTTEQRTDPKLIEEIREQGTSHPALKAARREIYFVVCGDKEGTRFATFDVVRDYKGKIRELVPQPAADPHGMLDGRFVDLLVKTRH